MNPADKLDLFLNKNDFEGFLIHDSSENSNMYYLTGFEAADPFTYLRVDGKSVILVPQLEYSRAQEEADVDEVVSSSEFMDGDSRGREDTKAGLITKLLEEYSIDKLAVPSTFPLGLAEQLREEIDLEPVNDKVMDARKTKNGDEIQKIKTVQDITEKAMEKAEELIQDSEVKEGELYLDKQPLTSEKVRKKIKLYLLENSCDAPEETIVSCGKESAKPHSAGKGVLKVDKPVIVDIFPKHKNWYFGDMTRTFVKGKACPEIKEMKNAVLEAQEAAFEVLEKGAGVKASEVHSATCKALENYGYKTLRTDAKEKGMIHSTGHAVGLDLHEPPRISENEDDLKAGMILTIEPGLYDPEVGGVRIEDMVLIKKDGYENFNSMHKNWK